MLQLTVVPALPEDGSTPRIIYADELDLMDKAGWLAFEHIIVAHDRYVDAAVMHCSRRTAYHAAAVLMLCPLETMSMTG